MGTAGAGEEVISDDLRESIIAEHDLSSASAEGFKMDPSQCGKAGPVALITVWGSVPAPTRVAIVDALDNSGIEDGGEGDKEEDRGAQSWRGVGQKTLRIINIYKAVFGGEDTEDVYDPAGRRMCIANFFVNSKMASSLGGAAASGPGDFGGEGDSSSSSSSSGGGDDSKAIGFREFFLKNVLPSDDRRGDHDAMVLALAVNCQTSKRMQLLWKLYGALASKFGLTKNDIHLSVGVPQVQADVRSLLDTTVDDLLSIRDQDKGWKKGRERCSFINSLFHSFIFIHSHILYKNVSPLSCLFRASPSNDPRVRVNRARVFMYTYTLVHV